MNLVKKHSLLIVIVAAVLLRLALFFLDYSFDVNNHIIWGKDAIQRGLSGFYETRSSERFGVKYPNYPPLAIYIFSLIYPLQSIFYKITWWLNVNIPVFPSKLIFFVDSRTFLAGLFKIPSSLADFGIAYMVYLFIKDPRFKIKGSKLLILSLILFNPAFFYNSAYWGQIDAIPIFLALFSFYFLIKNRPVLSTISFALALLVKPTALIYLPFYLILLLRKNNLLSVVKSLTISLFVFWLYFLPFFKTGNILLFPFATYYEKIMLTQSLAFISNGAFNFWLLISQFKGIKDTTVFLMGLSYQTWGYLITSILFIFIGNFLLKKKDKTNSFFHVIFLGAFASFLFLTKMHERYTMLPLPFLLLISLKDRSLMKWFIVFSVVSFLNLYHSWPVPHNELLIKALDTSMVYTLLSILNIIIFFYFLIVISSRRQEI